MINVRYIPEEYSLEVSGHAGYAEAGKDIVCAGASALTMALMQSAFANDDMNASYYIDNVNADIMVQCDPLEDARERCSQMFEIIMNGFRALCTDYPEYIRLEDDEND